MANIFQSSINDAKALSQSFQKLDEELANLGRERYYPLMGLSTMQATEVMQMLGGKTHECAYCGTRRPNKKINCKCGALYVVEPKRIQEHKVLQVQKSGVEMLEEIVHLIGEVMFCLLTLDLNSAVNNLNKLGKNIYWMSNGR